MWHYKDANADLIRQAINSFDWNKAFSNTNVDKKVTIFNEVILNIISNFIPHVVITVDDREPPWFNKNIREIIQSKNKLYVELRKNKSNTELLKEINFLQEWLHQSIESSKQRYYSRMADKLSNL